MTRFARVGRRPDHWSSPHERASVRAAERLDAPLSESESDWLDEHLAGCPACLATADAYETDRLALRSLGATMPEPPRDLWARTSAAIEQEAAGRRRVERTSTRRPAIAQFGAIAGIAVVAVLVGSSVLSGAWLDGPIGTTNGVDGSAAAVVTPGPTRVTGVPGATPIAVDAGAVGWFDVGADGSYAYNVAPVDEVCAEVDQASCAALADDAHKRVALASSPKSIIASALTDQAVVVGDDDSVFVVDLPGQVETTASPDPTVTPEPVATATPDVTATPATSPDTSPSTEPTTSAEPSVEPTPETSVEPIVSPSPTAAALAIISGVTVVGDAAAFSPDGAWFAFTARPADGSVGPDIYVWRVGDARAQPITTDHASAFGSWADGQVIGSRPAAADAPVLFSIDPSTGDETILARNDWRPAVDPTGKLAVSWDGTVTPAADGTTVTLTDGRLVLDDWAGGESQIDPDAYSITDGSLGDFTVRWDETGTWLAVWVAGVSDPSVGRLSLLHIDPKSGDVERPKAGPQDVLALPGFSIENGRLAWATPPSQDGEGSRVQIVAWSADGVGSIESAPGTDVVVVR